MSAMLYQATSFSSNNYDAFLVGMSNRSSLKTGVKLSASAKYSSIAAAARSKLISTYGWTITDGGQL